MTGQDRKAPNSHAFVNHGFVYQVYFSKVKQGYAGVSRGEPSETVAADCSYYGTDTFPVAQENEIIMLLGKC